MTGFTKHFTFGEKEFDVEINNRILADTVNKFPKYYSMQLEFVESLKDEDKDKEMSGIEILSYMINNGFTDLALCKEDEEEEITKFVLPKILLQANKELTTSMAKAKALEIWEYAVENESEQLLIEQIVNLVQEVFISQKDRKPKLTIVVE